MCVWNAYAAKREASRLLWDLLNRIEGIWGGFSTGTAYNLLETFYFGGHIRFEKEEAAGPAAPGRIYKIYWI